MTVFIAESAKISSLSDIETSVRGSSLSIGEGSIIDSFVKIKFAGGMGDIEIGQNCSINSGCVLYSGNGIKMGNQVLIAANTVLAPTNHAIAQTDVPIQNQGFMPSRGGIVIEDNVWIGAGCIVLDGTIIKSGCVIGAGSIVSGTLESNGVYVGNPMRFLKYR
jgi:acetyltransferase-like isoleucine patch superfamily enzyme